MYRIILVVSLLLNLVLASAAFLRSRMQVPDQPTRSASLSSHSDASGSAPPTAPHQDDTSSVATRPTDSTTSLSEFKDMLARLRSSGVPEETLQLIAESLAREALADKVRRESRAAIAYAWQEAEAGRLIPADRHKALEAERETLIGELLGGSPAPAGAPREFMDDPRLAAIPAEKREQIYRIQQEQNGARSEGFRTGRVARELTDLAGQRAAAMEPIRALLTPEEDEHYMLYFSQDARELQSALIESDIDDPQYIALYRALRDAPRADRAAPIDQISIEVDIVARIGGADAAVHYARGRDGTFRSGVEILKSAGLPSSEILARRKLYWAAAERVPNEDLAARSARLKTTYDAVTAGLSPESRAAFDQTPPGRQFAIWLRRP